MAVFVEQPCFAGVCYSLHIILFFFFFNSKLYKEFYLLELYIYYIKYHSTAIVVLYILIHIMWDPSPYRLSLRAFPYGLVLKEWLGSL